MKTLLTHLPFLMPLAAAFLAIAGRLVLANKEKAVALDFKDTDTDTDGEPAGCLMLLAPLVAFTHSARWLVQPDTRPAVTGGSA